MTAKYHTCTCVHAEPYRVTIASLLSIPEPAVMLPNAAHASNWYYVASWCFLVTKISLRAAEKLVKQQHWSTPSVTFMILFAPPVSHHLCSIENMMFADTEEKEVNILIRCTLLNSEQVWACNPAPDALQSLVGTIEARPSCHPLLYISISLINFI